MDVFGNFKYNYTGASGTTEVGLAHLVTDQFSHVMEGKIVLFTLTIYLPVYISHKLYWRETYLTGTIRHTSQCFPAKLMDKELGKTLTRYSYKEVDGVTLIAWFDKVV